MRSTLRLKMGLKGVLPLVVFFTAFAVAAADDSYSQCPHYPSSLPPLPDTLPEVSLPRLSLIRSPSSDLPKAYHYLLYS